VSIKNVIMRGWDGTVYTVPFSEINTIENMSRTFSYYLMDIRITYDTDTDEVEACLREIDAGMREDAAFTKLILEPIEIFGVERFTDSAVIVRARVKTQPIRQWEVGREFNRRMKQAFERRGIVIPYPRRTVVFGAGREEAARPPLPVEITGMPRREP
jgi:small conductance mechanosensitive channel